MNWKWVPGSKIHRYSQEWEELAQRVNPTDPFLTPAWLLPMVHDGLDFLVGFPEKGRDMKALLPLSRLHPRIRGLGGFVTPNSFSLYLKEENVSSHNLLSVLLQISRQKGWMLLRLEAQTSAEMDSIRTSAQASDWRVRTRNGKENVYLSLEGTYDEYVRSFSHSARRNLTRNLNKLHSLGRLELKTLTAHDDWTSILPVLERLESISWKWETGIFSKERRLITIDQLKRMAERNALLIFCSILNGQPIAYEIDFLWNDRIFRHNCAYDPQFAQASPGTCLLNEIVSYAFENGIHVMEHLGRTNQSKRRWMNGSRNKEIMDLYPPSLLGRSLDRFVNLYSTRKGLRSGSGHS